MRRFNVLKYVQETRKLIGATEVTCNFSSCERPFKPKEEKKVRDAPKPIGYLLSLWRDLRQAIFSGNYEGEELAALKLECARAKRMADAEVAKITGQHPDLKLRYAGKTGSEGLFVRTKT